MNHHLKNWLDGLGQVLVLYNDQDYLYPQRGDFRQDAFALRNDAAKITKGLRTNLSKNVKVNSRIR